MNFLENELFVKILPKDSQVKDKSYIFEGDKLIIKTRSKFKSEKRFIELTNPWNQLIFCRWLTLDHISEFIIDFPSELMSGNYFLKYSSDVSSKCWIFTHKGKFNEYNWYIAYGLTIDAIEGLEVRLAIPRTVHPYTVVEHLEIIGDKRILTDGDSHWLSLDLDKYSTSQKRVIFGYKAWIKQNFLLYHPESLKDESRASESAYINQYLISEPGIESNDTYVRKLSENITGNSIISLIYQISHRIHQHVKYRIQKGEFGAKYAVLNRQGDCTEYSALFVALCRQKGIPSRLVAGFKKTRHNNKIEWIRHAWAEFLYNDQWIPIDILEGFVIGNFPENIPLFRGNWI
ncbi:MAG: transglutaminase-like domain-containing protein, partial [Candidatus Hodarchaeales archaeon]